MNFLALVVLPPLAATFRLAGDFLSCHKGIFPAGC